MELEDRILRLEDDRAIRDLKARYLRACDLKQPEIVLETLLPGNAIIEFEGFPAFRNRDDFVAIFAEMGCAPGIFDMHHAANGIIEFESNCRASGKWSLGFHNINLALRTFTQMGVEYDDVYVKESGRWWIAETRSHRTFALVHGVDTHGNSVVESMGEMTGAFGE